MSSRARQFIGVLSTNTRFCTFFQKMSKFVTITLLLSITVIFSLAKPQSRQPSTMSVMSSNMAVATSTPATPKQRGRQSRRRGQQNRRSNGENKITQQVSPKSTQATIVQNQQLARNVQQTNTRTTRTASTVETFVKPITDLYWYRSTTEKFTSNANGWSYSHSSSSGSHHSYQYSVGW